MLLRIAAPLLFAGAVTYACGPQPHVPAAPTTSRRAIVSDTATLATSLSLTVKESVDLTLHVTNNTPKRLELHFPSGLTHDFVVLDSLDREVWRWSEGRMFTQALQTRLLAPGQTVTYRERWSNPPAEGAFVAVALLRSSNHPVETRVDFTIP